MNEKKLDEQVSDGLVEYDREKARRQIVVAGTADDTTRDFIATLDARWRLAKALAASRMIPQKTTEAAIAVMLKAHELGVPAMQGFGTIHFFDGKLILGAALMDGIAIRRCGVTKKILEHTDKVCRIEFRREGWEPIVSEFSIEDAKTAGLLGVTREGKRRENWHRYPKDMLYARAVARGVRMIAPDFFAGAYERDEIAPEQVERAERGETGGLDDLKEKIGDAVEVEAEDAQVSPKEAFNAVADAAEIDLAQRAEILKEAGGDFREAASRVKVLAEEREE